MRSRRLVSEKPADPADADDGSRRRRSLCSGSAGSTAQHFPQKSYIGHVEAIKAVDLRPQVTGYVEKVLFQEGSLVNEGDILFVIEQKRYLATVELRKAELDSAKANLVRAERDYKRQKSLSSQNYASKATLDTSESNYLQAKAAVAPGRSQP